MIRIPVALPAGEVTVSAAYERPESADPWATVVLAHGAGTRYDHPGVTTVAAALRRQGAATLRFNFPYSEQGRRMPGPPAQAITAWASVLAQATGLDATAPTVAAGRSYGGRMASMAAAEGMIDPAALVYLGYPLHPPGRPEALRVAHLPAITRPQLFLSGTRDPFVQPPEALEDAVASCSRASLEWIEGAGHSFEARGRTADEVADDLAARMTAWLRAVL